MYTILCTDDNELITTVKERIMQRSKLVDKLHFLVNQTYKKSDEEHSMDMTNFIVSLEYISPISKEYHSEILVKSKDIYKKEFLEYILPLDTALTKEPGDIELQLTFTKVDMIEETPEDSESDESTDNVETVEDVEINGDDVGEVTYKTVQYVRKTSPTKITIVPIAAWSDIVPDSALNALDQRLLKVDAQIKALDEFGNTYASTKADNIVLDQDTHELYLTAEGEPIGNKITISELGDSLVEGNEEGIIQVVL